MAMNDVEETVSAFTTRRSLGVSSKSSPTELCTQISPGEHSFKDSVNGFQQEISSKLTILCDFHLKMS